MSKKTSPSYLLHTLDNGKEVQVPANRAARRLFEKKTKNKALKPIRMPVKK